MRRTQDTGHRTQGRMPITEGESGRRGERSRTQDEGKTGRGEGEKDARRKTQGRMPITEGESGRGGEWGKEDARRKTYKVGLRRSPPGLSTVTVAKVERGLGWVLWKTDD